MTPVRSLFFALGSCICASVLLGCGDDEEGRTTTFGESLGTTTEGTSAGTTTTTTTPGTTTFPQTTTTGGDDTTADTSTTNGTTTESSTGDDTGATSMPTTGSTCDPQIPGEWNACIGQDGEPDDTLCNWTQVPGSTGSIACFGAAENPDASVCMIFGCEDECDCFDPPATGTAPVVCADVLAAGGLGCALDCSNGETCPDGMQCLGGLCFWPPA